MSIRRLCGTATAMAAAAAGLRAVTPDLGAVADAGLDLQRVVDTAGAETVLLAGVAALAWAAWLWGALGLTLTALSALPGVAGTIARALTRYLLPAGARRAAALALGVGLVTSAPLVAGCTPASSALPRAVAVAPRHTVPSPTGRRRPRRRPLRRHRASPPRCPTGRHRSGTSTSSCAASACGTSPPPISPGGPAAARRTTRWPRPSTPGGTPMPP
jgi:hypothetical protein